MQQIACGLTIPSENVRIYNYETGNLVKTLSGHSMSIKYIEILDENNMASGSSDGSVIIWNLTSYIIKHRLTNTDKVYCIERISSNLLASGDSSGLIVIWDWIKGTLVYTFIGHTASVFFSLDLFNQQTLISGSKVKTIKFWNISGGELIQTVK
jgi:WD40 repeat protein